MSERKSELDFFKKGSERYGLPRAYELMTTGYNSLIVLYVLVFGGYVSESLGNQWFNGMVVSGCLLWVFGPDRIKLLKAIYEEREKENRKWMSPGVWVVCLILGYLVWGGFELIKGCLLWIFWND